MLHGLATPKFKSSYKPSITNLVEVHSLISDIMYQPRDTVATYTHCGFINRRQNLNTLPLNRFAVLDIQFQLRPTLLAVCLGRGRGLGEGAYRLSQCLDVPGACCHRLNVGNVTIPLIGRIFASDFCRLTSPDPTTECSLRSSKRLQYVGQQLPAVAARNLPCVSSV